MDENIQQAQSTAAEQAQEQATPQQPAGEQEFQFSDEDIAFAQWSLTLGAYMQSLLSDPARAADEFEAVARSLREQFQQPEREPEPPKQAEPQQPSQSQNQNALDIGALVQQAVEQAVSKVFEQMRKQSLASPGSLSGRAVSSRRLADLIE